MRDRLKDLMSELDVTQSSFAKEIGLTPSAITDYLKGRANSLSSTVLAQISERYKVSLNWLLTGEGEMFLRTDGKQSAHVSADSVGTAPQILVPSDEEFIPLYNALPGDDQKEVRAFTGWRAALKGISIAKKGSKVKEPSSLYAAKVVDLPTVMDVPLLGQIAAGNPIFASDNVEQILHLPQGVAKPKGRRLFALRVRGESMIGAGIHNGDFALLREVVSPLDEVANGDIVAAVVGTDATLKRVFFEDHSIILKAENPAFAPIVCQGPDRCQVVGALVMTWRWWEKG